MTDKNVEQHVQQPVETDPIQKAKQLWQQYSKPVVIAVAGIVVLVGGWYAYQGFVAQPNEEKAQNAIFKAEEYFAQDSLALALKGDGSHKGFLYIINNFGGTKSGNLAKYYAGLCCLRTGDFKSAAKYLEDFSTDAKQIQMMAYGALGDAYSELGKKEDAVQEYEKAAETFPDDDINASEYLYRAAVRSEVDGKLQQAADLYKKLKNEFPNTQHGREADKYIHRLVNESGLSAN